MSGHPRGKDGLMNHQQALHDQLLQSQQHLVRCSVGKSMGAVPSSLLYQPAFDYHVRPYIGSAPTSQAGEFVPKLKMYQQSVGGGVVSSSGSIHLQQQQQQQQHEGDYSRAKPSGATKRSRPSLLGSTGHSGDQYDRMMKSDALSVVSTMLTGIPSGSVLAQRGIGPQAVSHPYLMTSMAHHPTMALPMRASSTINSGASSSSQTVVDRANRRPRLAMPPLIRAAHNSAAGSTAELSVNTNLANKKMTTYSPQVEAISPTLPNVDERSEEIRHSKEDLLISISKMDREINNTDNSLQKLRAKYKQMEEESKAEKPSEELEMVVDSTAEIKHETLAQKIYSVNRKRAALSQNTYDKYTVLNSESLPLYHEPSDVKSVRELTTKFAQFKPLLVQVLMGRKRIEKSRMDTMRGRYEQCAQLWAKKMERRESTAKRKAKDAKVREIFEKIFPELKKQREEKEKVQRVTTASNSRVTGYVRSEANVEEIVDGLHEQEMMEQKMRSLAAVVPVVPVDCHPPPKYVNENGFIPDPSVVHEEAFRNNFFWTDSEKQIFTEKYIQQPKKFGFIADFVRSKSAEDCCLYYYMSKKIANYKQLVRRHNMTRRRRYKAAAVREEKEKEESSETASASSVSAASLERTAAGGGVGAAAEATAAAAAGENEKVEDKKEPDSVEESVSSSSTKNEVSGSLGAESNDSEQSGKVIKDEPEVKQDAAVAALSEQSQVKDEGIRCSSSSSSIVAASLSDSKSVECLPALSASSEPGGLRTESTAAVAARKVGTIEGDRKTDLLLSVKTEREDSSGIQGGKELRRIRLGAASTSPVSPSGATTEAGHQSDNDSVATMSADEGHDDPETCRPSASSKWPENTPRTSGTSGYTSRSEAGLPPLPRLIESRGQGGSAGYRRDDENDRRDLIPGRSGDVSRPAHNEPVHGRIRDMIRSSLLESSRDVKQSGAAESLASRYQVSRVGSPQLGASPFRSHMTDPARRSVDESYAASSLGRVYDSRALLNRSAGYSTGQLAPGEDFRSSRSPMLERSTKNATPGGTTHSESERENYLSSLSHNSGPSPRQNVLDSPLYGLAAVASEYGNLDSKTAKLVLRERSARGELVDPGASSRGDGIWNGSSTQLHTGGAVVVCSASQLANQAGGSITHGTSLGRTHVSAQWLYGDSNASGASHSQYPGGHRQLIDTKFGSVGQVMPAKDLHGYSASSSSSRDGRESVGAASKVADSHDILSHDFLTAKQMQGSPSAAKEALHRDHLLNKPAMSLGELQHQQLLQQQGVLAKLDHHQLLEIQRSHEATISRMKHEQEQQKYSARKQLSAAADLQAYIHSQYSDSAHSGSNAPLQQRMYRGGADGLPHPLDSRVTSTPPWDVRRPNGPENMSERQQLTAASLIEAIISQQINKTESGDNKSGKVSGSGNGGSVSGADGSGGGFSGRRSGGVGGGGSGSGGASGGGSGVDGGGVGALLQKYLPNDGADRRKNSMAVEPVRNTLWRGEDGDSRNSPRIGTTGDSRNSPRIHSADPGPAHLERSRVGGEAGNAGLLLHRSEYGTTDRSRGSGRGTEHGEGGSRVIPAAGSRDGEARPRASPPRRTITLGEHIEAVIDYDIARGKTQSDGYAEKWNSRTIKNLLMDSDDSNRHQSKGSSSGGVRCQERAEPRSSHHPDSRQLDTRDPSRRSDVGREYYDDGRRLASPGGELGRISRDRMSSSYSGQVLSRSHRSAASPQSSVLLDSRSLPPRVYESSLQRLEDRSASPASASSSRVGNRTPVLLGQQRNVSPLSVPSRHSSPAQSDYLLTHSQKSDQRQVSGARSRVASPHGSTTALHGATTALHSATTALHGATTALHSATTTLHGATTALHGATTALHDDRSTGISLAEAAQQQTQQEMLSMFWKTKYVKDHEQQHGRTGDRKREEADQRMTRRMSPMRQSLSPRQPVSPVSHQARSPGGQGSDIPPRLTREYPSDTYVERGVRQIEQCAMNSDTNTGAFEVGVGSSGGLQFNSNSRSPGSSVSPGLSNSSTDRIAPVALSLPHPVDGSGSRDAVQKVKDVQKSGTYDAAQDQARRVDRIDAGSAKTSSTAGSPAETNRTTSVMPAGSSSPESTSVCNGSVSNWKKRKVDVALENETEADNSVKTDETDSKRRKMFDISDEKLKQDRTSGADRSRNSESSGYSKSGNIHDAKRTDSKIVPVTDVKPLRGIDNETSSLESSVCQTPRSSIDEEHGNRGMTFSRADVLEGRDDLSMSSVNGSKVKGGVLEQALAIAGLTDTSWSRGLGSDERGNMGVSNDNHQAGKESRNDFNQHSLTALDTGVSVGTSGEELTGTTSSEDQQRQDDETALAVASIEGVASSMSEPLEPSVELRTVQSCYSEAGNQQADDVRTTNNLLTDAIDGDKTETSRTESSSVNRSSEDPAQTGLVDKHSAEQKEVKSVDIANTTAAASCTSGYRKES